MLSAFSLQIFSSSPVSKSPPGRGRKRFQEKRRAADVVASSYSPNHALKNWLGIPPGADCTYCSERVGPLLCTYPNWTQEEKLHPKQFALSHLF